METKETKLFHILDNSVEILKQELNIDYLEALIHTAENLVDNRTVYNEENQLTEATVKELASEYQKVPLKEYEPETIRKAMQLALLKGMREDYIQVNHQMTPDSLGTLLAYLIEIIVDPAKNLHLVDLSVGTANLLLTIYHFLKLNEDREVLLSGIDNDEFMLSIASTNSAIQRTPIQLQYQDALSNLLLEPADVMVSDLPVGFYPVDERAATFETHFPEADQMSYSHYLLIEQAIKYLKKDGYGFFLLPSNLFKDEKVSVLVNYLNEAAYIQAVIQLPQAIFANEDSRKSVLIIQKKGPTAKQAEEVLLTNAPDFKDMEAMKSFLGEINEWKNENI